MSEPSNQPDTIVLIHGLWMTARSWEHWAQRYSDAGYRVIADSWPGLDSEVENLRRDPSPLAGLGVGEIVDHYARIIDDLERPPIIIGHSFGGTFTQILLDRGYGAAGVAIASAAIKGVMKLPFSTLRTAWPVLKNPANRKRAVPLSPKQFNWRFTNDIDLAASQPLYDRYCVPATGRVLFQGGTANFNPHAATAVNVRNPDRAPLLFIAGSKDHVSPPALVKANAKRQRKGGAVTEYAEYAGRTHFLVGQSGWEEIADRALEWTRANTGAARAAGTVARGTSPA